MNRAFLLTLRLLACTSSIALALPCMAQVADTPAPADPSGNEPAEIVVTAQKRAERLNDVPLSVTAASGRELASAGITDTSQLGKIVPGFTYQLSQYGTPVYGIRGVSFFDTSGTAQPAVSVYVDQIPLPLSILARGAPLDVERVEVLKGPQGTLFGQNATGGAINYIAAKPTSEFASGADVTFGRFNQFEIGGFISAPLGDTVGIRVAARSENRDDWQYSTTRRDANGQRAFNEGRVLLDWKPSNALRFELNLNGWVDRSDTQAAQFQSFTPLVPNGYQPAFDALSTYRGVPRNARGADWDPGYNLRRDDRFWQAALRADWDLSSAVTITSLSSYIRFKGFTPSDPDGTSYNDIRNALIDDIETVNQELRAAATLGPVRLLVGGNYEHAKLDESGPNTIGSTNSLIFGVHNTGSVADNFQRTDTYAAFGSIDYNLTDTVTVQGAVRYTKQDRDYHGCARDDGTGSFAAAFSLVSTALSGTPTVIPPGACFTLDPTTFKPAGIVHRALDQDNVSWRGGIDWKPSNAVLLYANVTKGYKAGGFSTLPTAFTPQIFPVTQESVLAYEAGTKLDLLDRRLQLTAAGFHYDYTDKQIAGYVLVLPFGNLPSLVNVPKSRINGAEVSLNWQPSRAIRLSASGNYLDTRVTRSYTTLDPFARAIDIRGEALPATPKWQFSADGEYRFLLPSGLQPYVGAAINYQDRSYAVFGRNADFILPSRTLVDVRAGIVGDKDKWRVELFGRNVTNEYYWIQAARQIDTVVRLAGMPATYGARVTLRR